MKFLFKLLFMLSAIILLPSYQYTFSNFIITDLTSTDDTGFAIEASAWYASSILNTNSWTVCNGVHLLGGYGGLGGPSSQFGQYFQRNYTGLPSHNMIYYNFIFQAIDTWDLNTYDRMVWTFDARIVSGWFIDVSYWTTNVCGIGNTDGTLWPIFGRIIHNSTSLTLTYTSLMDEYSQNESWGIREIYMMFVTSTTSKVEGMCVSNPNTPLGANICACAIGYYESGYPGSGVCSKCHSNCASCFGASERECFVCSSGKYFNGYACITICDASCGDSYYGCNGDSMTSCINCKPGNYLINNNTCLSTCISPFVHTQSPTQDFCESPCGQAVASTTFLYPNGSCLATCGFPLTTATVSTYTLCTTPCTTQQYLMQDGTCQGYCNNPWVTRSESGGLQYCDYPCKTQEFLYWNQTCADTCLFPLVQYFESPHRFCQYPCGLSQFLHDDGSCQNSCPSPLLTVQESGYGFCRYQCNANQFLFWNSSCLSTCPYPLVFNYSEGQQCKPPCQQDPSLPYYYVPTAQCVASCQPNYTVIDSTGLYRQCTGTYVAEAEIPFFTNTFLTSGSSSRSFIAVTKIMHYIRYIDIPLPPRLDSLMSSKAKPFLSIRYGWAMDEILQSDFDNRILATAFSKRGLNASFLVNYWEEITTFVVMMVVIAFAIILEQIFKKLAWTGPEIIAGRSTVVIKWNFFIMLFMTGFGDIVLFTVVEFQALYLYSFSAVLSLITCIVVLGVVTSLFIDMIYTIPKYRFAKKTAKDTRIYRPYGDFLNAWEHYQVVFRGFKEENLFQAYFYLIYMIKLGIPFLVAGCAYKYPLLQSAFYTGLSILTILYICIVKPIRKKIDLFQLLLSECAQLVINGSLLLLCILNVISPLGSANGSAAIYLGDIVVQGNFVMNILQIGFLLLKVTLAVRYANKLEVLNPNLAKAFLVQTLFTAWQQGALGFEQVQVLPFMKLNFEDEDEKKKVKEQQPKQRKQYTNGTLDKNENNEAGDNEEKESLNPKKKKEESYFEAVKTRLRMKDQNNQDYYEEMLHEVEMFNKAQKLE